MLIGQYRGKALRAGANLRHVGDMLLDFVDVIETLTSRNTALESVVKDLLEQHERQIDMEDCAGRCSHPDKYPEWNRAWKNAREVLEGETPTSTQALATLVNYEAAELLVQLASNTQSLANRFTKTEVRPVIDLWRNDARKARELAARIRDALNNG